MSAHLKRLTALLLSLALSLGLVSATAWGADTARVAIPSQTESQINPIYDGIFAPEDMNPPERDEPALFSGVTYYTNLTDAGAYVRQQMKKRAKTVTLGYKLDGDYSGLVYAIFEEALAHTRVPTEGDYLRLQYAHWDSNLSGYQDMQTGTLYLTIEYIIDYLSSAAEETTVDKEVAALRKQLNLKGKSRADKIRAIYNYICKNVTYDHVHLNDSSYKPMRTAYGALHDHTAVCQGYAVLLYRLLLEEQVDCRVIIGEGISSDGESGPHGWNIVRIGSEYYDVDSTWDSTIYHAYQKAGLEPQLQFYLCSDGNFARHVRYSQYQTSAFYKQYPMSSKNYDAKKAAALTKAHDKDHSWIKWSETAATSTKAGSTLYTCTVCGDSHKDTIPKRNSIKASNVTTASAASAKTFPLKATAKGGTLSYKSDNSKVKVSADGKVTLPKNFVGTFKITVTAKGGGFETVKKKVTVKVNPASVKLTVAKNEKGRKIRVCWEKNTSVTGYEVQYARNSSFSSGKKTLTVEKGKTSTVTLYNLTRKKTYYVRVRTYKKVSGKIYRSSWSGSRKAVVKK